MNKPDINRCGYAAIVGRPNVGKSTLINRLVGQKLAITSHKAQTSRYSILGVKTVPGAGQILFVDTPGIHKRGDNAMNRYLNRSARGTLADVDVVVFVVQALRWTGEDELVLKDIAQQGMPAIAAVNKVDKVPDKSALMPFLAELAARHEFAEIIPVSAKAGTQLEMLEKSVLARLPEGPNFYPEDQLTDRSERFFAAELLREQLTRRYSGELPYALSVQIEQFKQEGEMYRISALVWVERPGQKAILLGAKGEALKQAATLAREAMEKFFERKVFLKVWIKIKKSWSSDESAIARLGYGD